MQRRNNTFGDICEEISSVLWNMKSKHKKQKASENVQQKILQKNIFPEINADKTRLKIKQFVLWVLLI